MCVTRWFCRQEGASSCPCCRRESGQYDDVPHAAEDEEGSEDDESVSGWSDDDGSLVSVEEYWERKAEGTWHQKFRETVTGRAWNPGAADDIPPALAVGASMLQALWRGHVVRRNQVVDALLSLKNVVHVTVPLTSDPVP
jgi:hypothetical protein